MTASEDEQTYSGLSTDDSAERKAVKQTLRRSRRRTSDIFSVDNISLTTCTYYGSMRHMPELSSSVSPRVPCRVLPTVRQPMRHMVICRRPIGSAPKARRVTMVDPIRAWKSVGKLQSWLSISWAGAL